MARDWRRAGRAGLWLSGALLAAALAVAASDPLGFQKVGALSAVPLGRFDPATVVDVAPLLRAMPDRGIAGSLTTIYDVLPARKRQRTLVEGWGNCSNLVFGLAIELDAEGVDYEIVHMMPPDHFLDGQGHTVLRAKVALPEGPRVSLVGVSSASIRRTAGRPLDIDDLGHGAIPELTADSFRPEIEDWDRFYSPEFQSDLILGRMSSADLRRYFRFIEAVYVDLGLPPYVEKIAYDGLALVLGYYPTIHAERLAEARRRNPLRFAVQEGSLWTLRLAPLALVASVAAALYGSRRGATGLR